MQVRASQQPSPWAVLSLSPRGTSSHWDLMSQEPEPEQSPDLDPRGPGPQVLPQAKLVHSRVSVKLPRPTAQGGGRKGGGQYFRTHP